MLTAWLIWSVPTAPADSQPGPIQHLVFHSRWNLISGGAWLFFFFLSQTEGGRAEPSLCSSRYGEIAPSASLFSLDGPPSAVLLADGDRFVPQLSARGPSSQWAQTQRETREREEENGEREPVGGTRLRRQAGSYLRLLDRRTHSHRWDQHVQVRRVIYDQIKMCMIFML